MFGARFMTDELSIYELYSSNHCHLRSNSIWCEQNVWETENTSLDWRI